MVLASWSTLALFAIVAIPDALGVHALNTPATIFSVTLFLASLPIWIYSFGLVLVRSTRGDVRDPHRFTQKRPQTLVFVLQSLAAAGTTKN